MTKQEFDKQLELLGGDLSGLHIMVLGDVMIDRYIIGNVNRISPEAPVPVLDWKKTIDKPGGASNVVANLKSMGCRVSLLGLTGQDPEADLMQQLLEQAACDHIYLVRDNNRPTSLKTRIMTEGHQITRVDKESTKKIKVELQSQFLEILHELFKTDPPKVLILQDYNKGLLHKDWISAILKLCDQYSIKTAVDPKRFNFFEFKNVTLFKPNLKEAKEACNESSEDLEGLELISNHISESLNCEKLMITLAAEGIWISDLSGGRIFPTTPRKVADVSGAGDTVISLAAICIAYSLPMEFMAYCCNEGGGQVCEKIGVGPVDKTLLIRQLGELKHQI